MHFLQPHTTYAIHEILIAVPVSPTGIHESDLADGISEMMNNAMVGEDRVFHDWQSCQSNRLLMQTDDNPEEGQVFCLIETPERNFGEFVQVVMQKLVDNHQIDDPYATMAPATDPDANILNCLAKGWSEKAATAVVALYIDRMIRGEKV